MRFFFFLVQENNKDIRTRRGSSALGKITNLLSNEFIRLQVTLNNCLDLKNENTFFNDFSYLEISSIDLVGFSTPALFR